MHLLPRTPLTSLLLLPTLAFTQCTRPLLASITTSLLHAQTLGTATFPSLSPNTTYTQNRKPLSLDAPTSILTRALTLTSQPHPTRLVEIESIVTTTGDWLFNVTGTQYWASREAWTAIPEAQRDTRETIKAAGDAYCDVFKDKAVAGGMYTGRGAASDRCDVGVPSGVSLVNRRYVIDEEYGTVDIMMDFAGREGEWGVAGLPDSHEFRVERGRLRYVHTLSSCGGRSCMG
ncbi:hypothetical protein M011DRAFT_492847 [Sporormia fimetaria CBS 119925]|uniref:DUF8021 domain-containing protein n=1 Tax=Sporormia fimetaria CBS 119925 TaxID=1340428 RepID=A0A6A6VJ50_9PLEO|nr:hypothetical protein M011DRAFT_492847 [Sporormia fimetaria CBS 119925]